MHKITFPLLKILCFWICVGFFPLQGNAKEKTYVRAEIYYIPWDNLSRARLTLPDVRASSECSTKITAKRELKAFVSLLGLQKMSKLKVQKVEDPKLVIDLFDSNSEKSTFYASYFNLVSKNGLSFRKINAKFRKGITYLFVNVCPNIANTHREIEE